MHEWTEGEGDGWKEMGWRNGRMEEWRDGLMGVWMEGGMDGGMNG